MIEERQRMKKLLLFLASENRTSVDHHPTGEELVDYHTGRMAPERIQWLEDHLGLCEDCRSLLLDLADYPKISLPEGTMPEVSDRQVETAFEKTWKKIAESGPESSLAGAAEKPRERIESAPPVPAVSGSAMRVWMPLAAVLFFGCLGLSLWIVDLRRTVEVLSGPQVNVAVADFFSKGDVARSSDEPQELEVAANQSYLTLIIHLDSRASGLPAVAIRLLDDTGRELWFRDGLEPGPGHTVSLGLPRRSLPPGEYRLVVDAPEGHRDSPLQEYSIRIVWP